MAPEQSEMRGLTTELEEFINKHEYSLSSNAHRVINNVFGDLYGIDQLIYLMNRLVNEKGLDVGMVFCIADIFDYEYYDRCVAQIEELGLTTPARSFIYMWRKMKVIREIDKNTFEKARV